MTSSYNQMIDKPTHYINESSPCIKPEYWHRTLDNVRQKIKSCSTKAVSERTQLSSVKLKKQ